MFFFKNGSKSTWLVWFLEFFSSAMSVSDPPSSSPPSVSRNVQSAAENNVKSGL